MSNAKVVEPNYFRISLFIGIIFAVLASIFGFWQLLPKFNIYINIVYIILLSMFICWLIFFYLTRQPTAAKAAMVNKDWILAGPCNLNYFNGGWLYLTATQLIFFKINYFKGNSIPVDVELKNIRSVELERSFFRKSTLIVYTFNNDRISLDVAKKEVWLDSISALLTNI